MFSRAFKWLRRFFRAPEPLPIHAILVQTTESGAVRNFELFLREEDNGVFRAYCIMETRVRLDQLLISRFSPATVFQVRVRGGGDLVAEHSGALPVRDGDVFAKIDLAGDVVESGWGVEIEVRA